MLEAHAGESRVPHGTTLYRAAWVLPVSSPPIPNGAVLVGERGTIAAVAPAAALQAPPGAHIVELGEAALLPGLVNVHAHPELAMFRGALEDLRFPDWILRLVGAKRAVLREEDFAAAARWSLLEMLRAGITTVAATEASAASVGALRDAGMRGLVYQEVFGPAPAQVNDSMTELRTRVEQLRQQETDLVRIGVSPHAPYTVSDELFRSVAEFALQEGLPLATHAAEARAEQDLVTQGSGDFAPGLRARNIPTPRRGESTIQMLERLGVLRARPLLIHGVRLNDADIRLLAEHDAAVAHCPIANARLGHGVAPLPQLLEAGVRVALGTDSVGSNNRTDLLEEARFASLLHRATHQAHDLLPAEMLLRLCTIGGARALGWEDRMGTLEPGKDADLCAVSLAAVHARPVHDPIAAVFHAARGTDVVLTVVRGQVLFRDGRCASLDEAVLRSSIDQIAERLRGALG